MISKNLLPEYTALQILYYKCSKLFWFKDYYQKQFADIYFVNGLIIQILNPSEYSFI